MQRRDFLKTTVSLAALSSIPSKGLAKGSEWVAKKLNDDLPIARVSADESSSLDFNGDNIDRPHDILWNIDGYIDKKGGEPAVTEELDVIVVGGGIAGLSSAYYLRNKKVALLEFDTRLGGNSKGELYKDACYSIGAAYLCEPAEGTPLDALLKELNIHDKARKENGEDTSVFFKDRVAKPFWQGATTADAHSDFKKFHNRLSEIYNEVDFSFDGAFAKEHDRLTVDEWVAKEFGELHPHLLEYLQLYGWSSFCGSTDELSAFQYLGFISAETGAILAYPGGNAYVAHKMAQQIRKDAGENSLRSGCMVMRVKTEKDSVTVLFEDGMGVLKKARARHVVMACPKFVANRLIPELSKEQSDTMRMLPYRAYLVGNVITKKPFQTPSFELYCLKGSVPPSPTAMRRGDRNFTDICFGTWAQQDQTEHSVLTLYHGIPYDGARQFLFNPISHDKYRDKYLADVEPILKGLNLTMNDIHGIRMTRWGHAVPLSRKGMIVDGTAQLAATPVKNLIHFAHQDNWMTPCFEASHQAALDVIQLIK
ncbi:flavin monoamine oxidase family protein [Bdellovibrio sp. HCB-110]|uniref:flavin monoamine oxidase family protein n=1 Tax=Bdellovibrio sp. HCB-110 TaxID=3391182 RepID=UPI0039B501F3